MDFPMDFPLVFPLVFPILGPPDPPPWRCPGLPRGKSTAAPKSATRPGAGCPRCWNLGPAAGKHTKNAGKSPFLMGKSFFNGHVQ